VTVDIIYGGARGGENRQYGKSIKETMKKHRHKTQMLFGGAVDGVFTEK
jgi:hypothetical protein